MDQDTNLSIKDALFVEVICQGCDRLFLWNEDAVMQVNDCKMVNSVFSLRNMMTYPFLFALEEMLRPRGYYDGVYVRVDGLVLTYVFANVGQLSSHCDSMQRAMSEQL